MKKIILLIFSVLLLSGCSVQYELSYYDNIYSENLNIIGLKDNNNFVDAVNQKINEVFVIDYDNDYGDMDEQEVLKNYSTYNKTLINDNEKYGIKLNYIYQDKKKDLLDKSNIINTLFESVIIDDNMISVSKIKNIYTYYSDLDDIVIKFNTDKYILESNADKIDNDIYYWYINKDNYANKSIKIVFDNDSKIVKKYKDSVNKFLDYFVYIFLIFVLLFILFIYNKVKKSNK